jgi:sulfur carrier protein
MKIIVAGKFKDYPEGLRLSALIERENIETPEYVTVALNDDFAESGMFDDIVLKEGDSVEFLYFMGGGRG